MAESILEVAARLSQKVDTSAALAAPLLSRYAGDSPLSYLSPEARQALGDRLQRVSANFCRVAVDELAQRMRIVGVSVRGEHDPALWASWRRTGMVTGAQHVTKGALITGRAAVSVWTGGMRPESASQTAWSTDPLTGLPTEGFKRWRDAATGRVRAALYLPDRTVALSSRSHVPEHGIVPPEGWTVTGEVRNPLNVPLLVPVTNALSIESAAWGDSEMTPLMAANDLLEKFLTDAAVNSETFARPQRFVSGLEDLPTDDSGKVVNPFADGKRTWIATETDVKFGQLPADFGNFDRLISQILQMLAGLSGLPANVLGVSADNPTSADAIAASGLTLTSRAEDRSRVQDAGWSLAAAMQVALRDGGDPLAVDAGVIRADPRYSSEAAEADSVSKLVGSGLLSKAEGLRRLGYDPETVARIQREQAQEAALAAFASVSQDSA